MSFNSLFFISVFLPSSLIIYYSVYYLSKKNPLACKITLLVLSLFFYCYGAGFINFGILIGATFIHFLLAFYLSKVDTIKKKRTLLIVDIVLSTLTLLFFKYINLLAGTRFNVIFPLALSFYTFQSISYVVDVYRNKIDAKEVKILSYFLYLFIFMKLTEGPITEYNKIKENSPSFDKFYKGTLRFCFGMAKKILIADILATTVALVLGNATVVGTGLSWNRVITKRL